ncbi:MAG: DUF4148 domain-containing protein [Burkholderiaceae bacterium]
MNITTLAAVAAVSFATSLGAYAEGSTYDYAQPVISHVSRAAVVADLNAARAAGALVNGELSYVAPVTGPTLTRADVATELAEARNNHELLRSGEFTFAEPIRNGSSRS